MNRTRRFVLAVLIVVLYFFTEVKQVEQVADGRAVGRNVGVA
jgi:hypothetical protein